jgi:WD40 repeat protein
VRLAAGEQSLREALGFIGGRLVVRADGSIKKVAISPDNRWVVIGSFDNTARLWDLGAKDPPANPVVLRGHEGGVNAVAISPDNRWVVTGSWDNTARLWIWAPKIRRLTRSFCAATSMPQARYRVVAGEEHRWRAL